MMFAITVSNLPDKVKESLFRKILEANGVYCQALVLLPASQEFYAAHLGFSQRKSMEQALRIIQDCEISGEVLQAQEAGENAIRLLEKGDGDKISTRAASSPRRREPPRRARVEPVEETEEEEEKEQVEVAEEEDEVEPVEELDEVEEEEEAEPLPDEVDDRVVPFDTLGLSPVILENLKRLGYETTMPIQALAIPPAMEGCDLIGRAQTGTGKTLAFALPMVERLLANPGKGIRAMVVAPTRELAIQIKEVMDGVLDNTGLRAVVVYGGDPIMAQVLQLMEGVDILIATPGRLLDLQSRRRLRIDAVEVFVLDEADRMLDMGFLPDINKIFKCFYQHPQTMLFSATIPKELYKLAGVDMREPVYVDAGVPELTPLDAVHQRVIYVSPQEKDRYLYELVRKEEGPILVFVRTRRSAERLAQRLKRDHFSVTRIHGDVSQSDRNKALEAFRRGARKIMVATDVAARGLDIEGIAHVVNYDLPMAPEDHLHRIGRTARAGASGKATTFITHSERNLSRKFKQVLGQGKE